MYGELAKVGKLENIEVTENNIKDFLKTAQKYDIDYALKKMCQHPLLHITYSLRVQNPKIFRELLKSMSLVSTRNLRKISKRCCKSRTDKAECKNYR